MNELEISCPNCNYITDEISSSTERDDNNFHRVCTNCGTEIIGNMTFITKNLSTHKSAEYDINYYSLPKGSKLKVAYDTGYEEGEENGYESGYEEGKIDGYNEGEDDGRAYGYKKGLEEGLRRNSEYIMTVFEFEYLGKRLWKWREERNIAPHTQKSTFIENMCEEVEEFYTNGLDYDYSIKDEYEYIDALSDMIVVMLNSTLDESGILSELHDYVLKEGGIKLDIKKVFFKDELNNAWDKLTERDNIHLYIKDLFDFMSSIFNTMYFSGYHPFLVVKETCKEISGRTQDPIQKKRWDEMRDKGILIEEKWEKDKDSEVQKRWYKANYEKAKRK